MGISFLTFSLFQELLLKEYKMKSFTIVCISVLLFVSIFFHQEVDGLFFGAPRNNCSSNRQCRKTGLCRRVTNGLCSANNFVRRLFNRRARNGNCSAYRCAECTRDSHCGFQERCSGYSCVSRCTSRYVDGEYKRSCY